MKIQALNSVSLNSEQNRPKKIQGLKYDTFEKSKAPSFKGTFVDELSDEILNYAKKLYLEKSLKTFMDVCSTKAVKSRLFQFKAMPLANMAQIVYGNSDLDANDLINLFKETKLTTFAFFNCLSVYNSSKIKKIFLGQEVEFLKIYSELQNKDDLNKFPELLLYLYNQNQDAQSDDEKVNINEITNFLKSTGLNDFKDFDEKNYHLKARFNDFENISDKYDAINYLKETYDKKIDLINRVLSKKPEQKGRTAQKVYTINSDIIDYLFETERKNAKTLSLIIDEISSDKFKRLALKQIEPYFKNFETPQDKVQFYTFLNLNNISPDEFNSLMKSGIISDNNYLKAIINKPLFTKEISAITGNNEKQSFEIYKNFSDILNAIYSKQNPDNDKLETFFKTVEIFKIKDSQEFINLYNSMNLTKKKSLTSEEFSQFIELMAFCDSDKIIQNSRTKKLVPIDILREENEKYLKVKDEIKEFISEDENGYCLGFSPLNVYLHYKDLINKNPFDIKSVLLNIISLDIKDGSDYEEKTAKLKELEEFFDDKKSMYDFILNTNIKFGENEEYFENVKKLLAILKNNSNDENYAKYLEYIKAQGFLMQSKNSLGEFLDLFNDKQIPEIIDLIAKKRVASTEDFLEFIKKYENDDEFENVIKHLETSPDDVDFDDYRAILQLIEKKIDEVFVPIKINNQNIQNIDIDYFRDIKKLNEEDTINVLNALNQKEGNFINTFENVFINYEKKCSRFNIANEIINKSDTEAPYQNIVERFKLDKQSLGLDDNCSDYIYASAIAQKLPKQFMDFVNSYDWLTLGEQKYPNMPLHAKLRFIERYAMDKEDLYSDETKSYLNNILKYIYQGTPVGIEGDNIRQNTAIFFDFENEIHKAVFAPDGTIITIIPKGRYFI